MIQLGLTRAQMLADIGVREGDPGPAALEPEDPAFAEREPARLVVRAHHREELFARLEPALRLRFRRVASTHLQDDLQLRVAGVGAAGGLHIPEPLGAFGAPALSLFRLDPSETFRQRARAVSALRPLELLLRIVANGLAAIHLSLASPAAEEGFEELLDRHRNARQRIEQRFSGEGQGLTSACFERLLRRSGELEPTAPVPIHGALEWDCIVASGERWQLYRFDRSRLSHPGLDVGAFLADLLRFHGVRAKGDRQLWEAGRAAFLDGYFEGRRASWSKDLDWFVASALLERLERMTRRQEEKWAPKVAPLLDQIERLLAT